MDLRNAETVQTNTLDIDVQANTFDRGVLVAPAAARVGAGRGVQADVECLAAGVRPSRLVRRRSRLHLPNYQVL